MNGIALAYSGVHQMFQLALAAHELGELDGLFCSVVDGEGKWGRRLGRWVPAATMRPLGWEALPQSRLHECPWPVLVNRALKKMLPFRQTEHRRSNGWFDHSAARWLRASKARVFVGGETCALHSLRLAGELGMRRVLDCPGMPAQVLDAEAQRAAAAFDVQIPASSNSPAMQERKRLELAAADVVLCCSEFQRQRLVALNPGISRVEVVPLWADVSFWSGSASQRQFSRPGEPLRVLYAGAVSLRKGVAYLLDAVESLQAEITLTMVGAVSPEMEGLLKRFRRHRLLPYLTKSELRNLYLEHDVLVMPTLGDSFGFVTVEAMASGMPVIASQNAGAPLPDESWRVPPHDAQAIHARLLHYHADREQLRSDAESASAFGAAFRPERYRVRAGELFKELLTA
jgi:glycosyltransferase involved in cell wall biosynthesis